MILKLTFVNPLGLDSELILIYPHVDYSYWIRANVQTQEDVINKLDCILKDLDCSRVYSIGRPMMIEYPIYNTLLNDYLYYLLKIDNQFVYNLYIDLLLIRHVDNVIFQYNNPINEKVSKSKEKKTKKTKVENKYLRRETKDLFTGETIYFYENPKTGDSIESKNPNLLEELNKPKRNKKETKTKSTAVPLSAMTFSFAKKK